MIFILNKTIFLDERLLIDVAVTISIESVWKNSILLFIMLIF